MKKIYIAILVLIVSSSSLFSQNKPVDTLLETCGALSAQGVYITYAAIGTLADGYAYGVYDDEMTVMSLSEYIALSQVVTDQLNELLATGYLHRDDVGFIIELNSIYELLIYEADALSKFVETQDEYYITIYDDNRMKAWNKIVTLLELE